MFTYSKFLCMTALLVLSAQASDKKERKRDGLLCSLIEKDGVIKTSHFPKDRDDINVSPGDAVLIKISKREDRYEDTLKEARGLCRKMKGTPSIVENAFARKRRINPIVREMVSGKTIHMVKWNDYFERDSSKEDAILCKNPQKSSVVVTKDFKKSPETQLFLNEGENFVIKTTRIPQHEEQSIQESSKICKKVKGIGEFINGAFDLQQEESNKEIDKRAGRENTPVANWTATVQKNPWEFGAMLCQNTKKSIKLENTGTEHQDSPLTIEKGSTFIIKIPIENRWKAKKDARKLCRKARGKKQFHKDGLDNRDHRLSPEITKKLGDQKPVFIHHTAKILEVWG